MLLLGLGVKLHAAGPHGVDVGWTVDHSTGHINFTSASASALTQGGTGWIRVEIALIKGHSTWDATMFSYYDTVVSNAQSAGLQVLMLIDSGSWPGSQANWCTNNYENNHAANGDNAYIEGFATNAVLPIVQHFRDRVKIYELWNEPNCWTSNPSNGVYTGATYIYPSNFGWLLTRSWETVHIAHQINDVTLFSGGLFGLNSYGASYSSAGGQYLDDTYSTGTNVLKGGSFAHTKSNYGAYPLDGIGEHIYITIAGLVSSNSFRQYEDWVHSALTKYEGTSSPKKTFITEFGWQTTNSSNANGVSAAVQDTNLVTAFRAINAAPYVQTAIWFQWADNPAGGMWYGVVDSAGNPKPSYPDYQRYERFEGIYTNATTNLSIQAYFTSTGQPALGCPYDNGHSPWVYTNLLGCAQDYAGGSHSNLTVMASTNGTFEINNLHGLWSYYFANNGLTTFGAPLDNEFASGSGTRQDFFQGYLSWDTVSQVAWHQVLGAPPAPTTLTATPGNSQVTLEWSGSPTATSYYVKRSTTNGGPYTVLTSVVGPTVFTDAPLLNGTTYFYVVSALNNHGEGTNSVQVNATPDVNLANLPPPWQDADVGNVNLSGAAGYSSGVFSCRGAGADIAQGADAFHYACQPFNGDGTIIARVATLQSPQSLEASAKAGVMIRETLAANAIHVSTVLTGSNGVHRLYRVLTGGGTTDSAGPAASAPYWLKLTRSGSTFTAYVSSDGTSFSQIGSTTLTMASTALAGLVVCSHNTNVLDTATFDNVVVTPQDAPTVLAATPADGQVSLLWSAVTSATGYYVKRAFVSGGPYATVAANLSGTNYVDSGLVNGTACYYVITATNRAGEGPLSAEAAALPASPPVITAQPQSQTIGQGGDVSFSVVATNAAPLSYQWRFNGLSIAAATTSTFSLASAQPTDAGNYDVVVSDSAYFTASTAAVLTIRPILAIDSSGVLSWAGNFTLQAATNVAGPYVDVPDAASPYTNSSGGLPSQFFRLSTSQ
jgi:fibronectin type 3 domain-containing protein